MILIFQKGYIHFGLLVIGHTKPYPRFNVTANRRQLRENTIMGWDLTWTQSLT